MRDFYNEYMEHFVDDMQEELPDVPRDVLEEYPYFFDCLIRSTMVSDNERLSRDERQKVFEYIKENPDCCTDEFMAVNICFDMSKDEAAPNLWDVCLDDLLEDGEPAEKPEKPTVDEVAAYMDENNFIGFTAEQFVTYYDQTDWNHIKDWKMTALSWEISAKARLEANKPEESMPDWWFKNQETNTDIDEDLIKTVWELIHK